MGLPAGRLHRGLAADEKPRALFTDGRARDAALSREKELLLLDFLWMCEKHELCRPAHLLAKDKAMAKAMTKRIEDAASAVDLEDAERMAEKDVIQEREEALAKELDAMKRRKRKLVDPLQFEMSIQAEDLANYTPSFGWELMPVSETQRNSWNHAAFTPTTSRVRARQVSSLTA